MIVHPSQLTFQPVLLSQVLEDHQKQYIDEVDDNSDIMQLVKKYSLVGVISSSSIIQDQTFKYEISDNESIEVIQYVSGGAIIRDERIKNGTLVLVRGVLSSFRGLPQIRAYSITKVNSPNYEYYHWLKAIAHTKLRIPDIDEGTAVKVEQELVRRSAIENSLDEDHNKITQEMYNEQVASFEKEPSKDALKALFKSYIQLSQKFSFKDFTQPGTWVKYLELCSGPAKPSSTTATTSPVKDSTLKDRPVKEDSPVKEVSPGTVKGSSLKDRPVKDSTVKEDSPMKASLVKASTVKGTTINPASFWQHLFAEATKEGLCFQMNDDRDEYVIISHDLNVGKDLYKVMSESEEGVLFDTLVMKLRLISKYKHISKDMVASSLRILMNNSEVIESGRGYCLFK